LFSFIFKIRLMRKVVTLSILLLFAITFTTSCKNDTKKGPEYTSQYVCPMHCAGSGSATVGECPVCKMAYVKNEEHEANHEGHDHEGHDHDGHDHDGHDHEGHDHDGHGHEGHSH
jgi:hypothetical protein